MTAAIVNDMQASAKVYECATPSFQACECARHRTSMGQERPELYCPVAVLNFTTSSAGTRPRFLTSMPWALAHSRTSVVFRAFGCALRPLRAGRLALALTRRPAAT